MKNLLKSFIVFILQSEARLVMLKYKPKIIGVTGSVGKTGAKDAIFAVIENHFFAYKSKKSYNSEIGIPLTILMIDTGWKSPMLWLRNIVRGIFLNILKILKKYTTKNGYSLKILKRVARLLLMAMTIYW